MTDLEKYELINSCETAEDLSNAILKLSENGVIKGRTKSFDAKRMAENAITFINTNTLPPNVLTRCFGIRQQAMYIKYYTGA